MAEQEAGANISSKLVRLGERFEIYPERPLSDLRTPNAAAYAAADRERPTASLFALICDPDLPPRHDMMTALNGLRSEALMVPLEWGVVEWPATERSHFVALFDRPVGGRLVPAMTDSITPMRDDELLHYILPPLIPALRELSSAGLTHRGIRPTNLFFRDTARRQLVFGDCVCAPPAALQPVVCETIESGMAMPAGRGNGTASDDLYALGVTMVFLLLGRLPAASLSDEQVLAEKIGRGSYNMLLGGERFNSAIVEALRGLLTDDPRERWSVQDLEMWLGGRRLSPKQPALVKRAARPFEFSGHKFFTARSLAFAFARDTHAATRALKGPDFDIWMQRSLCDEDRSTMVAAAVVEGYDTGLGGQDERLVARVCVALDPMAPVRYKGFAAAIDGFGTALAAAFRGRASLQHIAEAMAGRLPQFWFSAQPSLRPDLVPVLKSFERLRLNLEDRRPGFGIERILYEMNPKIHCLSPLIESDYVVNAGDLLSALERASQRRANDEFAVDRHLAAFIAARHRGVGNDWLDPLHSPDPSQRALGTLYLLARLQAFHGPAAVPALAQRLAKMLPLVIDRYHNRTRRARLKAELPKIVAKGNLAEIVAFIDNGTERVQDIQGFMLAQREYAAIERGLELLRTEAPKRPARVAEAGARYAAVTASLLAWLIALTLVVAAG